MKTTAHLIEFFRLPFATVNYRVAPVRTLVAAAVLVMAMGATAIGGLVWSVWFATPSLDLVTDYQPKIPLRVYTADGIQIGEFGEEHREFVQIADVPQVVKDALLSIEDARFYAHNGIDFRGLSRAMLANLGGGYRQGASTITMQVARNFYLSQKKTLTRKLTEIVLAYRMERALTKDQILELYMNQIYLGQRTYGFSSAARVYFGKALDELSLAEAAMLAGVPQNPAKHNPSVNPKRAKQRQALVLKRMLDLGHISQHQYNQALAEKLKIGGVRQFDVHAEHVAEMARQEVVAKYGADSYVKGFNVFTSITKAEQSAAYEGLRHQVLAYDQRHGYRGPDTFIELPQDPDDREEAIDAVLARYPDNDAMVSAVVTEVSSKRVMAEPATGDTLEITGEGLKFAASALQQNAKPELKLRPGAVIRASMDRHGNWAIVQVPQVEAAFVALNAADGSYRALVGGFDFGRKQFNHATAAWRQPGSTVKPFIYSAALEKGFSPATLVNDAPLTLPGGGAGKVWEPHNDDGFDGPITLRQALARSKNIVAVRLLRAISTRAAREHLERFGFDMSKQPDNLTLALGSGSVTPLQMAAAYAVFANGGYRVNPWLIQKITDSKGQVLVTEPGPATRTEESRVLDARNAFIMNSMLHEVVRSGTAAAASHSIGRSDLAGKTGTTSDAQDGWFAGYAGDVVGVAWMGFDSPRSLGGREFGASLALPIWIDFMKQALAHQPIDEPSIPEGVREVDGDWVYDEFSGEGGIRALDMDEENAVSQ